MYLYPNSFLIFSINLHVTWTTIIEYLVCVKQWMGCFWEYNPSPSLLQEGPTSQRAGMYDLLTKMAWKIGNNKITNKNTIYQSAYYLLVMCTILLCFRIVLYLLQVRMAWKISWGGERLLIQIGRGNIHIASAGVEAVGMDMEIMRLEIYLEHFLQCYK